MKINKNKLNIFIAYSHADELLRVRLDIHLANMKRNEKIQTWFDRKIESGELWEDVIFNNLSSSDIILLLISPDFIASDYCYNVEMKKAIEMHEKNEAIVVPIILAHCDWQDSPFSKFQALPKDAKPVIDSKWHSQDEALHSIAEGIKIIVNRIIKEREDNIVGYFTEIDSLKSELLQLSTEVDSLRSEKNKFKKKSTSNITDPLNEKNKIIEKQRNIIRELNNKLSEYSNIEIKDDIIYPLYKAKIINIDSIYRGIYLSDTYKDSWSSSEIRELAGPREWNETNFIPEKGMVGNIVDSFIHKEKKTTIYVLQIKDKYYVPINENGITILEDTPS